MVDSRLNLVFGALSDPTRRTILQRLMTEDQTISQLARPLNMSLQATQKHLRVLEKAGLLATEKKGRERNCRIVANPMAEAEKWLAKNRPEMPPQSALQSYLGSPE